MARIVYVNGHFLPESEARVSVFDRGFLFADGVYEVSAVLDGKLVDNDVHLKRLDRSLSELSLPHPVDNDAIASIQRKLIALNDLREGIVYLEITRGVAERDFAFPPHAAPTFVMFTQAKTIVDNPLARRGLSVVTTPDLRWRRRDIKTVGLLAAVLAKQAAIDAGADDAWLLDEDGRITEGSSNNAFIITRGNRLITRALSHDILPGITRRAVLALAERAGLALEERGFTPAEARNAAEAFLTSASTFVMPVVRLDGNPIGSGAPGPLTAELRAAYIEMARA